MESIADTYEKFKNFVTLQGTQPGEQGLFGSLKTIAGQWGKSGPNPYVAAKRTMGEITPDQYDQIINQGYVDEWKQNAQNRAALGANDSNLSEIYNSYKGQVDQGTAGMIPFTIAEEMINKGVLPDGQGVESTGVVKSASTKIPTYSEKEKNRAINYFASKASTINPDSQHRKTPQAAKENAQYAKKYLNEIFRQAPKYNLDPMMLTAIAAHESGWGGTRYGHNLLGSGVFENGTNLGRGQGEDTMEAAVSSLLDSISKDWGGIYQNKTTAKGFVEGKYKWNTHPSWVVNVGKIRGNLGG